MQILKFSIFYETMKVPQKISMKYTWAFSWWEVAKCQSWWFREKRMAHRLFKEYIPTKYRSLVWLNFRHFFLTTNLLTVYFILLLCVHSPLPFLQLSICWHDSVGGMGLRSHKADGWGIQLVRPVFKFTIHHSLVSWPGIVLCFKNLICEMVKWEDNS